MDALDVLDQLRSHGATLTGDGSRLSLAIAPGQLTDELRAAITAHKSALLEALASRDAMTLLHLRRRLTNAVEVLATEEQAGRIDTRRYRDMLNVYERLLSEYRALAREGWVREEAIA